MYLEKLLEQNRTVETLTIQADEVLKKRDAEKSLRVLESLILATNEFGKTAHLAWANQEITFDAWKTAVDTVIYIREQAKNVRELIEVTDHVGLLAHMRPRPKC